jgi:NADPH2:quinone reductase
VRAAFYETQGPAREVLKVGTMADPTPGPDELRIRVATSGINPGDIKKRPRKSQCLTGVSEGI